MTEIDDIRRKIAAGETVDYDAFQALRAMQEQLEDALEMIQGSASGRVQSESTERASGPAFAIVVGHTARAPGAASVPPVGQNEYFWNTDLANKINAACTARNVESKIFFRDGIGIGGAYAQVNAWGATCVAELHFNAFNGSAHGTETLYDNDRNAGSKNWAQKLQDAQLAALDLRNRGLKEIDSGGRGFGSVSALDIPSALIEPFFGDNANDAAVAEANKDTLANAIADAAASQVLGA